MCVHVRTCARAYACMCACWCMLGLHLAELCGCHSQAHTGLAPHWLCTLDRPPPLPVLSEVHLVNGLWMVSLAP